MQIFFYRLYIFVLPFEIQMGEHSFICFTPPHFCACPNPGTGFPTAFVVVVSIINDLGLKVIIRFVDSGVFVNHHCLN
jgi:hypothetical protein